MGASMEWLTTMVGTFPWSGYPEVINNDARGRRVVMEQDTLAVASITAFSIRHRAILGVCLFRALPRVDEGGQLATGTR